MITNIEDLTHRIALELFMVNHRAEDWDRWHDVDKHRYYRYADAVIALLKDQRIIEPQLNNDDYANLKTELEKLREN